MGGIHPSPGTFTIVAESTVDTMATSTTLLPGDLVPPDLLPQKKGASTTLTLGPGLRYEPPAAIRATGAGLLTVDDRKKAVWLDTSGNGRYVPALGDLVLATVHHSSMDYWHAAITPYTPLAVLPQLSFEGAGRKTRPTLQPGSLVYARVSLANKHMDPELECVNPSTGKSDGLGELKEGMLFVISLGMARRLMMSKGRDEGGVVILEELAEKGLKFEIAVGRNGRLWVNSERVKTTLLVGRAVQSADVDRLGVDQQVKLVRKLVNDR